MKELQPEPKPGQAHAFPVGTLVAVDYYESHGGGACEQVRAHLFVLEHTRDEEELPTYTLSHRRLQFPRDPGVPWRWEAVHQPRAGFPQTRLRGLTPKEIQAEDPQ